MRRSFRPTYKASKATIAPLEKRRENEPKRDKKKNVKRVNSRIKAVFSNQPKY